MRSIKKFFAITLLALMVGLGTPAVFAADGTAESPGITSEAAKVTVDGTAEAPGYFGVAESPGFIAIVAIYLNAII